MRKLNKPLLRKLAQKLRRLRHEEHYSQSVWARQTDCGTAACIAGHAVALVGWRLRPTESPAFDDVCVRNKRSRPIRLVAHEALGIRNDPDPNSVHWLFSAAPERDWPAPYSDRWYDAKRDDSKERPSRIAADLLDAIADGRVEL